jgi:AcrR family transcriptional regulator
LTDRLVNRMSPRTKAQNLEIQEKTRQQILMAALEAFANRGYAHTSVSYLAKQAGISKGLIYHYFDSKEQVLVGIFHLLMKEGHDIMDGWEGLSPKEKLKQTIDQSVAFIEHQQQIMRFMFSLTLQPAVISDLESLIETQKKKSMDRFKGLFEELAYADPEAEALFTGAVLDGAGFGSIGLNDYPLNKIRNKLYDYYQL